MNRIPIKNTNRIPTEHQENANIVPTEYLQNTNRLPAAAAPQPARPPGAPLLPLLPLLPLPLPPLLALLRSFIHSCSLPYVIYYPIFYLIID